MPKLFEYFGLLLYFYSNEHEPIHVHAKHGEYESKAEFIIVDGNIIEIRITNVKGFKPLRTKDLNNFKDFLEVYGQNIVHKWIDYFVLHKDIKFEKIDKRIK